MKANTPLEQICFNTNDIKKLKEQIAPLYKSNVNLGALANVVDVADTNLTTDIEKAFIIDFNGNLYKFIAFNEDKTKAYIEYYANIKGEKGDTGETGETGADGQNGQNGADGLSIRYYNGLYINSSTNYLKSNLSNTDNLQIGDVILFKDGTLTTIQTITTNYFNVSSSNIKLEIQATTKGAFIAYSQPTESGDYLIYAPTAIYNSTANTQFSSGDLIIYVDSNDNPTEIYIIAGFSGNNLIVEKKAEYAKGKQLYEHLITWNNEDTLTYGCHSITIICDKATQFTVNELKQWLSANGHNYNGNNSSYKNLYGGNISGSVMYGSGNYYNFLGLINYAEDQFIGKVIRNNSSPFVWFTADSFFSYSEYKIRAL